MNGIFYNNKTKDKDPYTNRLLRSAEQRMNIVYMLIMTAFEVSILLYIFLNPWDDFRYFFGGVSGGAFLIGIVINAVFHKKCYPWIKYVNNFIMIFSVYTLCVFSDYMALFFIVLPLINSFYYRPYFTALTGVAHLFMTYVCIMSVVITIFDAEGEVNINYWTNLFSVFELSDDITLSVFLSKSFMLIVAVAMLIVSVYFSYSNRKFTLRQGDLIHKNMSTAAELQVAHDMQEGILSKDFPDNPSYAVYADMTPAAQVGGDFYDFFLIDETHLAIVVGDVSGHGMAAAMFMTLAKTLIKVYAQSHGATDKVLEQTNRYLLRSNPQRFFVTCWFGILDLTDGRLTYSNAGHNYPVLIRAGAEPDFLRAKPNFVLGRKKLIRYKENRIKLCPGDKLLLYTDGVTEAQAPDESFFGDERLLRVVSETKDKSQREMVEVLREKVNKFENGSDHYDDATLLALHYKDCLQVEPPQSQTFFLSKETFDSVTEYIAERCKEAGCDEKTLGQIVIATSEILANIDLYAYENGGEIEVLTKCRDRRMTIVFKDRGKPFNPLLVQEPDVTLPLNRRNPGGLGIFIVKKLMSETSYAYKNGQNMLTIEMDF